MNVIAENFFETIKDCEHDFQYGNESPQRDIAESLAKKVERFIEWIEFEPCPFECEEDNGENYFAEKYNDESKHYTTNDLFQYWLDNVEEH